jgi:hypothetical protein
MKLKNKNETPHGGFTFYFKANDGTTVMVRSNSLSQLSEKVSVQMRNLLIPVPSNIKTIIEHQICLRQPSPIEACWSSGLGDDLHHKWIAPFLKRVSMGLAPSEGSSEGLISRARKKASGIVQSIARCSSCSGTKVYDKSKNNLGRAGMVNKLLK